MPPTFKKVETISEFIDAIRIRVDVFVIEQKCPVGWDPEDLDKVSEHFVAVVEGHVVATARMREDPAGAFKIENMAVKAEFRGQGIGEGLTRYIISVAQKKSPNKIWIQAQVHAKSFYERCGFVAVSEEYDLHNLDIPHVTMDLKRC